MLQQQISNAQLQNLAAVQQVKVRSYYFDHVLTVHQPYVLNQNRKHSTTIFIVSVN